MAEQGILPTLDGPALVAGPVFLCFELDGKPGHKGRHRSRIVIPKEAWIYPRDPRAEAFLTKTAAKRIFVQHYADPQTESYESVLREYATLLMRRRLPTAAPVALLVHAFLRIPESWSKRDRNAALFGGILPTSRPDGDNYLKIVDALNGVVWEDDSQVVDGRIIKRYSDRPALRVEVREFIVAQVVR